MKKYYSFILILILLVSVSSCQPKDKFIWNAGFSEPKNYVASGPFVEYFYKGKSIAGTSSSVGIDPGWGVFTWFYGTENDEPLDKSDPRINTKFNSYIRIDYVYFDGKLNAIDYYYDILE